MKTKFIGILICTLLIATTIPITGQVTKNIISKDTDELNPLLNGDKWVKTFDFTPWDAVYSVQQTSDGGYILVGATQHSPRNLDAWLVKTDNQGDIMWDKKFGGTEDDYCHKVKKTSDGGYILVGMTESYGNGETDIWLVKADSNGNMMWDKTFGDTGNDFSYDVEQTDDGGYIIAGDNYTTDKVYAWLIKTDESGELEWSKTYGGSVNNEAFSVVQTLDGGYVISGYITNAEGTDADVWLFKIDSNGEVLWEKTLGSNIDGGFSMQLTDDGGFIITGITSLSSSNFIPGTYINRIIPSHGNYQEDILLIKTDNDGELLWEKTFDVFELDWGYEVQQTNDGGYIIIGFTSKFLSENALLIKTNSNGDKEWIKIYGRRIIGIYCTYSGQQTMDGGYILVGDKGLGPNIDAWLIKTDENGNAPTSWARNLMEFRLFELFPNLFPILRHLLRL